MLAVGAERGVDVVEVGVGQGQLVQRLELAKEAVVGLLVLPPGDTADEALIVQLDALAAGHSASLRMVVAQQCLVDFSTVGVAHHRVIAATIAGIVEALVADAVEVVDLEHPGEAVPAPALEAGACAQGLCVGMVEGVVLIDVLVAITQIEDRLALGKQVGKGFFGLGYSWRSRGQQQGAQQSVGTHGGFPGKFFRAHLSRAASTGVLAAAD